jgi:hypothetical protein
MKIVAFDEIYNFVAGDVALGDRPLGVGLCRRPIESYHPQPLLLGLDIETGSARYGSLS